MFERENGAVTMRSSDWYQAKALACITAWQHRYAANPNRHAIIMVCAVALHETACGDAWGQSGNWGAIQRPGNHTTVPRDEFEELHGDSSPITGGYRTWFWRFPVGIVYPPADLDGDKAGAWMLLKVLLDERPHIKEGIEQISPYSLARLMYETGYYEGFHDPRGAKGADDLTDGQRANIIDYANAIQRGVAEFTRYVPESWF